MFLHTYLPSPILISFGPFSVHWYGLFMFAGIAAGYAIARRNFSRAHLTVALLNDLFTSLVLGGFVGARLYHVVNEFGYYWSHTLEIFAVWRGGLAIHGALLAGVIVIWFFIRKHNDVCNNVIHDSQREGYKLQDTITRKNPVTNIQRPSLFLIPCFLFLADLLAPSVALGQAIGRWGNYFRQELYGLPTSLPWGIPIDAANRLPDYTQYVYYHPVFLYESVWLIVIFLVLLFIVRRQWRPSQPSLAKGRISVSPPYEGGAREGVSFGRIFFLYLILAGLGRFFIEFLRIDPMPFIYGIRLQQLVSVVLIMIGIAGLELQRHALSRNKQKTAL